MNYHAYIEFAKQAHGSQTRLGTGKSYFTEHVLQVANMFDCDEIQFETRANAPDEMMDTLYLVSLFHDILEDTKVTTSELYDFLTTENLKYDEKYRLSVDKIVSAVNQLTYDKTVHTNKDAYIKHVFENGSFYAVAVKLADRFQNIVDMDALNEWSGQKKANYLVQTYQMIEYTYTRLAKVHKPDTDYWNQYKIVIIHYLLAMLLNCVKLQTRVLINQNRKKMYEKEGVES